MSQSEKPFLPTRQLENKTVRRRKSGVSDASSYTSTSPYVFAFNSPLRPAPLPKPAPPMATKKEKENKVQVIIIIIIIIIIMIMIKIKGLYFIE